MEGGLEVNEIEMMRLNIRLFKCIITTNFEDKPQFHSSLIYIDPETMTKNSTSFLTATAMLLHFKFPESSEYEYFQMCSL